MQEPTEKVKRQLSNVISSGRRINCRDLSAEACRNARTCTALMSTRLSEFAKAVACYRFVCYHLQEHFGRTFSVERQNVRTRQQTVGDYASNTTPRNFRDTKKCVFLTKFVKQKHCNKHATYPTMFCLPPPLQP